VLPIKQSSIASDQSGKRYKWEVSVEDSTDTLNYPEGVKAVFRLVRLDINQESDSELVILIDNHRPIGFHSHDKLPEIHDFRTPLHITKWKEAWNIFQTKCKEILG
jgi:hypothetical protein